MLNHGEAILIGASIQKASKICIILGDKKIPWPLGIINSNVKGAESFWPRISLITPSFNQAQFIEETIISVLGQGYPNLEYIIIDGGSTDGSVEIIKKYDRFLKYWVSEPDNGQSGAINKGFKLASGEIVGWLNSDDILLPFTFWKVGILFKYGDVMACSGNEVCLDVNSKITGYRRLLPLSTKWLLAIGKFSQPTIFWRREIFDAIGFLDENLHYAFDYEFFLRISSITNIFHIDDFLSGFRYHNKQKTANKFAGSEEAAIISASYIKELFRNELEFRFFCNICRLEEIFWYFYTRQFRAMAHPLKRFFKRGWRK